MTLESVQHEAFDLIFLPGGHGPLVDLADDGTLREMLARQDAAGLSHVERDGNLLTGQNPNSSHAIGKAMLDALHLAHAD